MYVLGIQFLVRYQCELVVPLGVEYTNQKLTYSISLKINPIRCKAMAASESSVLVLLVFTDHRV